VERTYTTPRLDKLGIRPGARVAIVGAIAVVYGTLRERAVRRAALRGEWVPAGDAIMLVLTGLLVALAIGLLALLIGTG